MNDEFNREFDRIMRFFDLDAAEKEKGLKEIFEDSIAFFERFKHVMENGTEAEKTEAVEKVMQLKKKIEEETTAICQKTGFSPEELAKYAQDPKNFPPDQWQMIEEAKRKLEQTKGTLAASTGQLPGGQEAPSQIANGGPPSGGASQTGNDDPSSWIGV